MTENPARTFARARILGLLTTLLLLLGCSTFKLVGEYDPQIDQGTTALQREFETFLVMLEASAAEPGDRVVAYTELRPFYAESRVGISGLRLRADAIERNSLTVQAFDKLAVNLARFEEMHREGITRAEIERLIRPGFNAQFTAILTFELAKRRGGKPEEAPALLAPTPLPQRSGGAE